jgi:hypothetical protein
VQANNAVPQSPQSKVSVTYNQAQTAGNTNVIAIGWNDATSIVTSVSDSQGNTYKVAVATGRGSDVAQTVFYASSIKAGANTVTVTFNTKVPFADIRIAEYSGIASSNPLDGSSSASGNGGSASSGTATTSAQNDLVFAAGMTDWAFNSGGSGYTVRVITHPDTDIVEDRIAPAGANAATAPVTGSWVMQAVAFKPGR